MITVSALLVVVALVLTLLHALVSPPRVPLWVPLFVLGLAMLVTMSGSLIRP